ncbi:MAG: RNA-binding domain-containing protein [Candidatus Bathycorpusculaceae bacterium]
MASKAPIAYIDIRVFAHATEDADKVLKALYNVLPEAAVDTVIFKKRSLTGHHGNPIILFEARLKGELAQEFFEKLSTGLGVLDKEQLSSEIRRHIENGNLYIRLDKQSAYLGEVKLYQTDPIHLRIHFKKFNPEEVTEICSWFGLIP